MQHGTKRGGGKRCDATLKDPVQDRWFAQVPPSHCSPVGPPQALQPQEGVPAAPHQALAGVLFRHPCTAIIPPPQILPPQHHSAVTASPERKAGYRPASCPSLFWFAIPLIKWTLPLSKTHDKEPTWNTTSLPKEFRVNKISCQIKSTVHLSNWGIQVSAMARFTVSLLTKSCLLRLYDYAWWEAFLLESFSVTGKIHLWMVLCQIHLIIFVLQINKVFPKYLYQNLLSLNLFSNKGSNRWLLHSMKHTYFCRTQKKGSKCFSKRNHPVQLC